MPFRRVAVLFGSGAIAVACSGDDPPPPLADMSPEGIPAWEAGEGALRGPGSPTDSADGGAASPDGAPTGEPPECGNALAEGDEPCDGGDLGGLTCRDFGFDEGVVACDADCSFDTSGCTGLESCSDGRDNDGDDRVDCADPDCDVACATSCAQVMTLEGAGLVRSTTFGHANALASSCSGAPSGREVVYRIDASSDGILDVNLDTRLAMSVSVRTACADDASEVACSADSISMPVSAGRSYFVLIEGIGPDDVGQFSLRVTPRGVGCGDGWRDHGEACDDGNRQPGDGCDPGCQLEASEHEPNDRFRQADAFASPFFGFIAPGDEDFVEVVIERDDSTIVAETADFGDGSCAAEEIDSYIEILDRDGSTVLAEDDDSAAGFCTHAAVAGLDAGTYFVRVLASPFGETPSFPYRLDITVDHCGNGLVSEGEECDDGNSAPFDGCDAQCRHE